MYGKYQQFENIFENAREAIPVHILSNLGLLTCYLLVIIYLCYWLFWKPYEFYEDFTGYGFEDVNKSHKNFDAISKRNYINHLRKQRKTGDIPPMVPNGWYCILESGEVQRNQVKEVNVLGLNLVAWRGESGTVYVSDAYCPHLGAHLAVGGKISKECITCPFHGWQFDGTDGHLVNVPYASTSKIPEEPARLKMKQVDERNGLIFLWFHAEGEAPSWFPERTPEVESGEWVYRGKTEIRVASHIQEIQENAADLNHLNSVHSLIAESGILYNLLSWLGIKYTFSTDSVWRYLDGPENKHKSTLNLGINQVVFNSKVIMNIQEMSTLHGPGIVYQNFTTPIGKAIIFTMMTPIEPHLVKMTHHLYSSRTLIHPIAKLILFLETDMISRDVRIWNRKHFVKNPTLPKEDSNIKKYRQWFKQFYSDNSSHAVFTKKNALDF